MVFLNSIQGVITIVIMIAIGYFLTWRKWIGDNERRLFSKLVVRVSLPAFMISNLLSSFTEDKLKSAGIGLVIPMAAMIITYLISIPIEKIIRVKPERRGTFRAMFSLSNTIFIGLPINLSLFGGTSVPYVLLYYIANTTFFWTIGVYSIRQDAGNNPGKIFSKDGLIKIINPPLIAFIISIFLILFKIQLPKFILDSCSYMGNLVTPLSMLFIGSTIYSLGIKNIHMEKDTAMVMVGRFIIAPLTIAFLMYFFRMPVLMKKVFIIQASLPVITQAAITTQAYDADYEFATVAVVLSTLASFVCIPLYILIFSYLF